MRKKRRRPDKETRTAELAEVWASLDAGDVPGVMRGLRFAAERAPLAELAQIVGWASAQMGFDDLAAASAALVADPRRAEALYEFGYAGIERGGAYVAIPALRNALAEAPGSRQVLLELVAAFEDEFRHADAIDVLESHAAILRPWPDRYLLVFNAVMAGDVERARANLTQLPAPDDAQWTSTYEHIRLTLERAAAVGRTTTLDLRALRGWHFVLNGAVLSTLSPYGYDSGMNGRWGHIRDSPAHCRQGLHRLRLVLAAADRRPTTVSRMPPARSSGWPRPGFSMCRPCLSTPKAPTR